MQGLRSPSSDSSLGSLSSRGAVHVAPQSGILACMDLGNGLGVASGSGITPMGALGFLTSTCMLSCTGWDSTVKPFLLQSRPYLTLLFRASSMPALVHGIGLGIMGIQGRTTGMVPRQS